MSERYNEIFFMIDTCQANTMYSKFYSPNILATGSSRIRENSYSVSRRAGHRKSNVNDPRQYENDDDVGVSVIDSYTHFVLEYLEGINKTSATSMKDLVSVQAAFSGFS
jgi:GPI-anchor transamidase subunit K